MSQGKEICEFLSCPFPAEPDSEHCIFHKEDKRTKSEITRFYQGIIDQAEAVEKDEEGNNTYIFEDIVWEQYYFPLVPDELDFSFKQAVFKGEANFQCTRFLGSMGNIDFRNSDFLGDANFKNVRFKPQTIFSHANFEGEAYFEGAVFKGGSDFPNYKGSTSFTGATFSEVARFNESEFIGNARFDGAVFQERTFFGRARFEKESNFDSGRFFEASEFKKVTFEGNASFRDVAFQRLTDFAEATFGGELSFANATFAHGISMIDAEESDPQKFNLLEAKQEGCRVQRISYEQEAKKEEADHMFVEEMKARRKQKSICWRILEYLIADLSCSYGTSWVKVLGWSALLALLLFPTMFWGLANALSGGIYITGAPLTAVTGWDGFLYYSLITFTTVGYGDLRPIGRIFKMLSATESAIGVLLAALIIVVFARKWMR